MKVLLWVSVVTMGMGLHVQRASAGDRDAMGLVSAAGGIVEPSYSTAVFTNPAGMTEIKELNVTLQAGSNENSLGNPTLGGGVLYGQGTYGMGAGLLHSTAGSGSTNAFYGLAVAADSIHTSFGISGETPISPTGGSSFNGAIRTAVTNDLTLALEAFDFTNGPQAWGAGISYQVATGVKLLSDFTTSSSFGDLEAQPGILVGTNDAALTVSYGFRVNSADPGLGRLSDGFAVGGGVNLSQKVNLALYYQELMKYYAVVNIKF
jgi:hypothetical protein